MEGLKVLVFGALLLATQLTHVLASPATVPAFLWSPHGYGCMHISALESWSGHGSNNRNEVRLRTFQFTPQIFVGSGNLNGKQSAFGSGQNEWILLLRTPHYSVKEVVNYRTISPKELASLVLSEGSWTNLLCSGENRQQSVDFVLVYIGQKLKTSDISRSITDPSLVELLKLSFARSNISMAFPYVAIAEEREKLENTLISGFTESCGQGLEVNNIVYLESCSFDSKDAMTLGGLNALHEHLRSKMDATKNEKADVVFVCSEGLKELKNSQSDGEILSGLVSFLDRLGATYSVLYASDPYSSPRYSSYPALDRFLLEETHGNGYVNSTYCDGVCQIKSSLLEGLFVGIVLLIILISGLCCMMGIETPSRFETPQES